MEGDRRVTLREPGEPPIIHSRYLGGTAPIEAVGKLCKLKRRWVNGRSAGALGRWAFLILTIPGILLMSVGRSMTSNRCATSSACGGTSLPWREREATIMKCTPGPWSIGDRGDIVAPEGVVCNVLTSPARPGNGRLIAAAPELLAVLHAIRCTLPGLDGDQGDLFDRIDEAIRKAEGKTYPDDHP